MAQFAENIVEFGGRYYLANWSYKNSQYTGPLRSDLARRTGCSGFFCRRERDLPSAGGYSYKTRSAAVRKARQLWGYEE